MDVLLGTFIVCWMGFVILDIIIGPGEEARPAEATSEPPDLPRI